MKEYTDSSIRVLDDITHIQLRPSMYISTDRPSYQMWSEIADNADDEAMNGFATKIYFDIDYNNGIIKISDNGRGLPQGINETLKKSTIEVIYTKLNSGGKYDQEFYNTSGGLNGVGSTVVNALSEYLIVTTWRNSNLVKACFENGKLKSLDKYNDDSYKDSGTVVYYKINKNNKIFTDKLINYKLDIENKLSLLKTLMPKVEIKYNGSIVKSKEFTSFLSLSKEPLLKESIFITYDNLLLALNWSKDTNKSTQRSYCNTIFTVNGGDHEKAVYDSVTELLGPDSLYGINIAISVNYPGVEYDSQAKTKAISKDMKRTIKDIIVRELKYYFKKNPETKNLIIELIRYKRNELNKRNNKSSIRRDNRTTFLNALTSTAFADCTTKDRSEAELFIVEGNSAAGSARQARDVSTQAVAPLRGKFINSYNCGIDVLLKNKEVQMILSSIDCGAFNEVNLAKSRYGKVIIFTDADPDGENIAVLLLSFFTNVVPELIENGYIYLALPPLYGTHYKGEFIPINNEETKNYYLRKGYSITRYKGLGEMPPNELAISCMNKDTRNIVKVEKSDNYKEFISKVAGGDSSYRKKLLIEAGVLYE